MKGYKAFEKGMICRGKQYAENTVFKEEEAKMGEKGMHFCEAPLDLLEYYPLIDKQGNLTEFAKVEALDEPLKEENKYCSKKLKIGAKLNFGKFVKVAVDYEIKKNKRSSGEDDSRLASSGGFGKLASSGDDSRLVSSETGSRLASSGSFSKLASSGRCSRLVSSGGFSELISSGDDSKLASSGNYSKLASSGDCSRLATSGDDSRLASSGDCSQLVSSGDDSKLVSIGRNCVIMCAGNNCGAKAKIGSWITLAEWKIINEEWTPINVVTKKVDGVKIKEDTFYTLKKGRFTEVKE